MHAVFLPLLLLKQQTSPPKLNTMFVELEPLAKQEQQDKTSFSADHVSRTANRGKTGIYAAPLSLLDLSPLHKTHLENAPRPGESISESDILSPYAASAEPFAHETKESFGAFAWAHRQLQLGLGYPEPFRRAGISGQADARFSFDVDGVIEPSSIRVKAASPYLRVYVHRLIERTFAGAPVPEKLRKWKNSLELFCFVQFSLVESETAVSLHMPTEIMGNRLFFARRSADGKNQLDKLKWKAGPLHGFFPIPAVGLDVTWFARQAEDLGKQKTPVDELAPFREDPLFYN